MPLVIRRWSHDHLRVKHRRGGLRENIGSTKFDPVASITSPERFLVFFFSHRQTATITAYHVQNLHLSM
jgi:hypothetical protein